MTSVSKAFSSPDQPLMDSLLQSLRGLVATPHPTPSHKIEKILSLVARTFCAPKYFLYILKRDRFLYAFEEPSASQTSSESVHSIALGVGPIGQVAQEKKPVVFSKVDQRILEPLASVKISGDLFAEKPLLTPNPLLANSPYLAGGFLGIPLIREAQIVGVLAVQYATPHTFSMAESEALQAVGMILATLLPSESPEKPSDKKLFTPPTSIGLEGVSLNVGLALGKAVFHEPIKTSGEEACSNVSFEKEKLEKALSKMQLTLNDLFAHQELQVPGEHREILDVYRMYASDKDWIENITEIIHQGFTAEAAVKRVLEDMKRRITKHSATEATNRLADLEDLSHRLLKHLSGKFSKLHDMEAFVMVAKRMGPADLIDYKPCALILEEGFLTDHVTIIARALNIPVVSRLPKVLSKINPGDPVIVDGDRGRITIRPSQNRIYRTQYKIALRQSASNQMKPSKPDPLPFSKDGVRVYLYLNAGLPSDLVKLSSEALSGVGLYRTEIPFMMESVLPSVKAQMSLYQDIFERAHGKPITFRTLDIGGDKVLPYLDLPENENPSLGWRAVRISLERPSLFRSQIRSLLRAAHGRELRIMVPMVADVTEFLAAKKMILLECDREAQQGRKLPEKVLVGTMLEVPSLAYQLPEVLKEADFISIGTNDLAQFFFAADRESSLVHARYDTLSKPFLSFLRQIFETCDQSAVPISVCGEMASGTLEAMVLVGLGCRHLSLNAKASHLIGDMIRKIDVQSLSDYMTHLFHLPVSNLRNELLAYAQDHKILEVPK